SDGAPGGASRYLQPERLDRTNTPWSRVRRRLSSLEKVAFGAFSDISFVFAPYAGRAKKRGFCQLRSELGQPRASRRTAISSADSSRKASQVLKSSRMRCSGFEHCV